MSLRASWNVYGAVYGKSGCQRMHSWNAVPKEQGEKAESYRCLHWRQTDLRVNRDSILSGWVFLGKILNHFDPFQLPYEGDLSPFTDGETEASIMWELAQVRVHQVHGGSKIKIWESDLGSHCWVHIWCFPVIVLGHCLAMPLVSESPVSVGIFERKRTNGREKHMSLYLSIYSYVSVSYDPGSEPLGICIICTDTYTQIFISRNWLIQLWELSARQTAAGTQAERLMLQAPGQKSLSSGNS